MRADLIHGLLSACHHQFSWPRREESGEYYQVCVHCGAKYRYDWTRMRRIAPVQEEENSPELTRSTVRKCGTKKAWMPRERRLRHSVAISFRVAGSDTWMEGTTENISRSGLLFRSTAHLEPGSNLELMFEMPHELTGEHDAHVLCHGSLVRVDPVPVTRKQKETFYMMACSIAHYKFVPNRVELPLEDESAENAS